MINIMFWNTDTGPSKYLEKGRDVIDECICSMISEYECDVLVLAEYEFDLEPLCNKISIRNRDFNIGPVIQCKRVKMLLDSRLRTEAIRDNKYFFINRIWSFKSEFLLAGVHFPSKMHGDGEKEQELIGRKLIQYLNESEKEVLHKRAIILGDFNANPFEPVMINADILHSYPRADFVLRKKSRKVYEIEYSTYYNPMWNFWGDKGITGGTYHYDAGGIVNLYWNIFDQVITSHDMVHYFLGESLKIVSCVGTLSLLNGSGIPDRKKFSDHLPIVFSIKEDM